MKRKLILKSPRFVAFGTNLAYFDAVSDIPGQRYLGGVECGHILVLVDILVLVILNLTR